MEQNKRLINRMYEKFKRNMIYKIEDSTADTNLYSLLLSEKESILNEVCLIFIVKNFGLKTEKKIFVSLQYDRTRCTDYDPTNMFRGKLERDLNGFQVNVVMALQLYKQTTKYYSDLLKSLVNRTKHFNKNDLQTIHQDIKQRTIEQVRFFTTQEF